MPNPAEIVGRMMAQDAYSQWLGIAVLETDAGYCRLQMRVRQEMTNGFGIAHGAICYGLADSALAFAANGYGTQAVSVRTAISHFVPVQKGILLQAEARETQRSRRMGHYEVNIRSSSAADSAEKLVAQFQGTVFFTEKEW